MIEYNFRPVGIYYISWSKPYTLLKIPSGIPNANCSIVVPGTQTWTS